MNPAVGENAPKWLCVESRDFSTATPCDPESRSMFARGPRGALSLGEASAKYKCPYRTLNNNVRAGKIKSVTFHGDYFITIEDLLDFMKHDWKPKPRKAL